MRLAAVVVLLAAAGAGPAMADAWAQPKGQGQVIFKFESMRADNAFDASGSTVPLLSERREQTISGFGEYGLTDRFTLRLKGDYQQGEDAFFDYEGRGPVEIGVLWQAWRNSSTAVSLYGGYAEGGDARNAGYALPGQGGSDWEVRTAVGHARDFGQQSWGRPDKLFGEVSVARRFREGLADEVRADVTVGAHFGESWMLLLQGFGGVADDNGPRWLSVEASAVRRFGDWSVQAGWRNAVLGRDTPELRGPVFSIWRRF